MNGLPIGQVATLPVSPQVLLLASSHHVKMWGLLYITWFIESPALAAHLALVNTFVFS